LLSLSLHGVFVRIFRVFLSPLLPSRIFCVFLAPRFFVVVFVAAKTSEFIIRRVWRVVLIFLPAAPPFFSSLFAHALCFHQGRPTPNVPPRPTAGFQRSRSASDSDLSSDITPAGQLRSPQLSRAVIAELKQGPLSPPNYGGNNPGAPRPAPKFAIGQNRARAQAVVSNYETRRPAPPLPRSGTGAFPTRSETDSPQMMQMQTQGRQRAGSDSELELKPTDIGNTDAAVTILKEGMLFHRVPRPLGRASGRPRPWRRRWCVFSRCKTRAQVAHTFVYYLVGEGINSGGEGNYQDIAGSLVLNSASSVREGCNRDSSEGDDARPFAFTLLAQEAANNETENETNSDLALQQSLDITGAENPHVELELAAVGDSERDEWIALLSGSISQAISVSEAQNKPVSGFFKPRRRGVGRDSAGIGGIPVGNRALGGNSAHISNAGSGNGVPATQLSFLDTNADSPLADNGCETVIIQHSEAGTVTLVEVPIDAKAGNALIKEELKQARQESMLVLERKPNTLISEHQSAPAEANTDTVANNSERDRVVNEIIATEVAYVTHLKLALKLYEVPLRFSIGGQRELIASPDLDLIFGGVETIYNYSVALLDRLKQLASVADWDSGTAVFCCAFVEMAPFFRSYFEYASKYTQASVRLKEIRAQKPAFQEFCTQRKQIGAAMKLDVTDLLITPVQRLPRYVLLIDSLLKHTPAGHPDRENTQRALEIMRNNVEDMNSQLGSAAEKAQLGKLADQNAQDSFFVVMSPSRKFHSRGDCQVTVALNTSEKGGAVMKLLRSQNARAFEGSIFLFTDAVLVARRGTNVLVEKIRLETAQVEETDANATALLAISTSRANFAFQFTTAAAADEWRGQILAAQQEMWQHRLQGVSDRLLSRG
jgi:RhoGEF domain